MRGAEVIPTTDPYTAYLGSLERYPLLSGREEEVRLHTSYTKGLEAAGTLASIEEEGIPVSRKVRNDLEMLVEQGQKDFYTFYCANLRYVVHLARRYQRPGVDRMDIIQEGNIALWRTVELFDPRMGYKFSTYAKNRINVEMQRAAEKQSGDIYRPPEKTLEYRTVWAYLVEHPGTVVTGALLKELGVRISLETYSAL